jgi:hypothetical protein
MVRDTAAAFSDSEVKAAAKANPTPIIEVEGCHYGCLTLLTWSSGDSSQEVIHTSTLGFDYTLGSR